MENNPAKPGWQTSEFWLALAAMVVAYLISSGGLAEGSWVARALGLAGAVLASLGYTASRAVVKRERLRMVGKIVGE